NTNYSRDWSTDVCSSDLAAMIIPFLPAYGPSGVSKLSVTIQGPIRMADNRYTGLPLHPTIPYLPWAARKQAREAPAGPAPTIKRDPKGVVQGNIRYNRVL